jgi:hypothetical protein
MLFNILERDTNKGRRLIHSSSSGAGRQITVSACEREAGQSETTDGGEGVVTSLDVKVRHSPVLSTLCTTANFDFFV